MTEPAPAVPAPQQPVRRWTPVLLPSVAGALAVFALVWVWLATPPEAARLLPECDAIVYANVGPLRAATHFDRKPVPRSPEFQRFIDATGIVPERDLDAVALAMHRMADPGGPNGAVAYSEVFAGSFDPGRLEPFLAGAAATREVYAGHTIYTLPMGQPSARGQRQLRVAVLGSGLVAASNAPTTEQIHAMLDRHRSLFSLFGGPYLLSGFYGEVPAFASGWAMGQVGLPWAEGGSLGVAGLALPLPADTPMVASVRYLGGVQVRLEALTANAGDAAGTARRLSSLLALFRALESQSGSGVDPRLRQGLDSLEIRPSGSRVLLTARLPGDLLTRLFTPEVQAPSPPPPASK